MVTETVNKKGEHTQYTFDLLSFKFLTFSFSWAFILFVGPLSRWHVLNDFKVWVKINWVAKQEGGASWSPQPIKCKDAIAGIESSI